MSSGTLRHRIRASSSLVRWLILVSHKNWKGCRATSCRAASTLKRISVVIQPNCLLIQPEAGLTYVRTYRNWRRSMSAAPVMCSWAEWCVHYWPMMWHAVNVFGWQLLVSVVGFVSCTRHTAAVESWQNYGLGDHNGAVSCSVVCSQWSSSIGKIRRNNDVIHCQNVCYVGTLSLEPVGYKIQNAKCH